MDRKGSRLADRFRRTLDVADETRRVDEARRLRDADDARLARSQLLDDLEAFGHAVGHLDVRRDDAGLTLAHGARSLRFEPIDDSDRLRVLVDGADTHEQRVYREAQLGGRWVWSFVRRRREERLPLFDAGLEELMVFALGLPRPSAVPADDEEQDGSSRRL